MNSWEKQELAGNTILTTLCIFSQSHFFNKFSERKQQDVATYQKEREECDKEVRQAEDNLRNLYDKIQNYTLEVQSEKLVFILRDYYNNNRDYTH